MSRLEVNVLGALEVARNGQPIVLDGERRRTLMAALVLRRGSRCDPSWLAELIWRGSPPNGASATLQSHVSILRRLLARSTDGTPPAIRTVTDGYLLDSDAVDVDADRFCASVVAARDAPDPSIALDRAGAALRLWRGTPFAEHADLDPFRGEVARLEHLAAEAMTVRLTSLAQLGRDPELIATGELAIAEHPLREQPWLLVAEALYRSGRQADALRCLHRLRLVLADASGLSLSAEAIELEQRMLHQDPLLRARPPGGARGDLGRRPQTRYASIDGVHIAYQVVGDSGPWLVAAPPLAQNIEICWEDPHHRRLIERAAETCRFVHFDKRGTGMSDRAAGLSMQERLRDFSAVLDNAGIDRAVLCGVSEGGPVAIAFAAAFPQRVAGLYLVNTYARLIETADYPIGVAPQSYRDLTATWESGWGTETSNLVDWFAPTLADDPVYRAWLAHYMRQSCSPGTIAAINRANALIDVRELLGSISAPTVIAHRVDDRVTPVAWGRYLAEHIVGSRLVEFEGADHLPWVGTNWAEIVDLGVDLAVLTASGSAG